ncbi:MAG: recombination protein RecR [Clostridia bacterium]|nr:recombination protein RecR [Clostridia bacterium]
MDNLIKPLQDLVEKFRSLDGVGRKSAMKMAFSVLDMTTEEACDFAQAILDAKTQVGLCTICQNLASEAVCPICASELRDHSTVCVVSDYQAVIALEKVKEYQGVYHVLHGTISPMKGIGPDKLKIKELLARINNEEIKEVIVATNTTVEGEATAMYLSKIIKPLGVKVTRIANGLPVGADLEYADSVTLFRAIQGRHDI